MSGAAWGFLRAHGRPIAVFALALAIYCVFVGPKHLSKPSDDNHYTHLADGWLHGRLHLPAEPPGHCSPKARREGCRPSYDDWARLYELRRSSDDTTFMAFPCRTKECKELARQGVSLWRVPGESDWVRTERGEVRKTGKEVWFVSFPPGPALLFAPFVALMGLGFWDVAFTCLLAAIVPALLVHMLDRERGAKSEHLWLAVAFALGSPMFFVAVNGSVWFTAQVTSALFTVLYLSLGMRARHPGWAGFCLAMATATRPFLILALPYFALEWWREGRDVKKALAFLAPLAVIGTLVASHNYARFSDPLEFGHTYLDIAWQPRMQEVGMFSLEYLPRNLQCLFWLVPRGAEHFPGFRVSVHGVALWISSPWIFALALAFGRAFPQRRGLLLALVVGVPALLYQNSGQLQYAHRFAIDWLPMIVCLVALGQREGDQRSWIMRIGLPALVVVSVLFNAWGAWHFHDKPGKLFVTDPPLWPFENELEWRG